MALVLDGTNGVSLVQDGVVTAADLNSTLDLTGKTLTLPSGAISSSDLPAGTIIQSVGTSGIAPNHEDAGNSNTFTSLLNNIDITCKGGTSSKFLITVYQGGSHCQAGTSGQGWIQRTVGGVATQVDYSASGGSAFYIIRDPGESGNNYYPLSQIYVDTPSVSAGTVINYAGRYKRRDGGNSFYYLHDGFGYGIHVLEIAG